MAEWKQSKPFPHNFLICWHSAARNFNGWGRIINTTGKDLVGACAVAAPLKKAAGWDDDDRSTQCWEPVLSGDIAALVATPDEAGFSLESHPVNLKADEKADCETLVLDDGCCVTVCKQGLPTHDMCGTEFTEEDITALCDLMKAKGIRARRNSGQEFSSRPKMADAKPPTP